MEHLGYEYCKADPDVWMRSTTMTYGQDYYEYILLYVKDCLCRSENPKPALLKVDKYFPTKSASLGPSKTYFGGTFSKIKLPNGVHAWAFSSSQYVNEAVKSVEEQLEKVGKKFMFKKPGTPIPTSYIPELDITPELISIDAVYYQSLVGILLWIVELGRVEMFLEGSLMYSHLVLTREGHLDKLFHIFAYLKWKHRARMVFDPTYPSIDNDDFPRHDWEKHYGEVKYVIPKNSLSPRGKGFNRIRYVDADLARDKVIRRSRTGL